MQGLSHNDTLEKTIQFHEGQNIQNSALENFPKRNHIKLYFKRAWIPLLFGEYVLQ